MFLPEFADAVIVAVDTKSSEHLAGLFAVHSPLAHALIAKVTDRSPRTIVMGLRACNGYLTAPWDDICLRHVECLHHLSTIPPRLHPAQALSIQQLAVEAEALGNATKAHGEVISLFLRVFGSLQSARWTLPFLRLLLLDHRRLSQDADKASAAAAAAAVSFSSGSTSSLVSSSGGPAAAASISSSHKPNAHTEEFARQLNKAFSACVADRASPVEHSRKWGTYEVVGLIFRVYFRLKTSHLCKNIIRALHAADIPPLTAFPRAHQVTYRYYIGVLAFQGEEYAKAEEELSWALNNCLTVATHNQQMILTYLIPTRLLRGYLPSPYLLSLFPHLDKVYTPLSSAMRASNPFLYTSTLLSDPYIERSLVRSRTYLACERAREVGVRALFQKCWKVSGAKSRLPVTVLGSALKLAAQQSASKAPSSGAATGAEEQVAEQEEGLSPEEVEWQVAVMIAKASTAFPFLGGCTVATS
ncbi:COP9 signalosome (CSN) subunit [Tilletia horrida]|uniref:COP9 signalosome (CSN) subunit n=1 Tax=Tilletia horrida TaxID=155126 RepID=A0AAN6G5B6_9BASI|nr:COP9 signalosome (CSN) subunit [Tilletia horrida]KAK0521084.1 COP9 signalosome (CSN) subunit [Tilletia horrida]KAK0521700.1 COP9 signalosome (CSN) subunit [Tilletia horrida]KAK0550023.1 COP9 signalosome (CSN) subunit [Tilletia horrida]